MGRRGGSTVVDGVGRTGLAGGTVLRIATYPDRYDLDATAGVSALVLDHD
jgi:hypothetical protein